MTRKMIFLMGMVVLLSIPFSAKAQQAFKPLTLTAKKSITIQAEDYNKGGKGVGYQARQMKYKNPTGDKFPILGWHGLVGFDVQTRARYQEMAAAGFNLNFGISWGHTVSSAQSSINASRGTGVRQSVDVNNLGENLASFKNDSEIAMWHITDEPTVNGEWKNGVRTAMSFAEVQAEVNRVRDIDDSRLMYVNLFNLRWSKHACGTSGESAYRTKYVKKLADEIGVGFISYDLYPFVRGSNNSLTLVSDFFQNLKVVAQVCRETNQPLWAFLCSTEHDNEGWRATKDVRTTSASDPFWPMRFELWSSLAYGMQCLQYFTYQNPNANSAFGGNAVVPLIQNSTTNAWEVTDCYYAIGRLNRLVEHLTPVFLGAKVVNVGHIGNLPSGTDAFIKYPAWVELVHATGGSKFGLVVSHLKNGDDEYLFLVNHEADVNSSITVYPSFKSGYNVHRIRADYDNGLIRENARSSYTVGVADYLLFHWNVNNN